MDYESLSDFEINKLVAEALGFAPKEWAGRDDVVLIKEMGFAMLKDYCNSPSDAWPIITESRMSMEYECDVKGWYLEVESADGRCFFAYNHNPLRAGMIVYLKMQEQ